MFFAVKPNKLKTQKRYFLLTTSFVSSNEVSMTGVEKKTLKNYEGMLFCSAKKICKLSGNCKVLKTPEVFPWTPPSQSSCSSSSSSWLAFLICFLRPAPSSESVRVFSAAVFNSLTTWYNCSPNSAIK